MSTNTGGPAFPVPAELCQDLTVYEQRGITVRDYFAAKAMQTYIADQALIDLYCYLEKDPKHEVAVTAYMMADAMLKAREA
jgi:hypothetical protein